MKQYIGHILFKIMVFPLSFIPFWMLYLISDFLSFLLYKVLRYRRKIIMLNLKKSFPEKSQQELEQIAKKYYKNLADISVEWFKGFSLSEKQLFQRYKIVNPELITDYLNEKKSIIIIGSHYCNWEWGALSFGLQFKQRAIGFYKPLKNRYTDKYIRIKRAAWGMHLISIKDTYRAFINNLNFPSIYFMISDQSPSNMDKAIWVNFLNQDTPCLHGPELYARKMNYALIYGDAQRIKRGYYTITLSLIESQPRETTPTEITKKMMAKLESIIIQKPENWLWSHKRWKRKRSS